MLSQVQNYFSEIGTRSCHESSFYVLYCLMYGRPVFNLYRYFMEANKVEIPECRDDFIQRLSNAYACLGICIELKKNQNADGWLYTNKYIYHQFIIVNEAQTTYLVDTYDYSGPRTKVIQKEDFIDLIDCTDVIKIQDAWNKLFDVTENIGPYDLDKISLSTITINEKSVFPDPDELCKYTYGAQTKIVFHTVEDLLRHRPHMRRRDKSTSK